MPTDTTQPSAESVRQRQQADLSLKQFKQQVMEDYRTAYSARQMLRTALLDADCGNVSARCDVAQVALSRFVEPTDTYLSAGLDIASNLAQGQMTIRGFFESLFASESKAEGTSDVMSQASEIQVAVGLALAQVSNAQTDDDEAEGPQSPTPTASPQHRGQRVVVCTIGSTFSADGEFLEAISFAASRSLPIAVVLWNNSGATTNGNLMRQLTGFAQAVGQRKTLYMESVKGDDYEATCRVMITQMNRTRAGATTLTFVSGSDADIDKFKLWLTDKRIATPQQIADLEVESQRTVERERRGAYLTSLVADTPLHTPRKTLVDIEPLSDLCPMQMMLMPLIPSAINKAIGVAKEGLYPVVESDDDAIASSLLMRHAEARLLIRTTSRNAARIANATPDSTPILTPATQSEARAAYRLLLPNARMAVVLESAREREQTEEPVALNHTALGMAHQMTQGEDVTIVSFGASTLPSHDATRLLSARGIRAELIHLGSLRPLDSEGLMEQSLRRTKRLCIVDSDPTGRTAHIILSHLTLSPAAMRYLIASPLVIHPNRHGIDVEPQQVCNAVCQMTANN